MCRYQGETCVTDNRDKPRCVCPPKCPHPTSSQSVCGSDGITYSSVCELHRTACSLGVKIKPNYRGTCGQGGKPGKFFLLELFSKSHTQALLTSPQIRGGFRGGGVYTP
jgi:hypothetical protein